MPGINNDLRNAGTSTLVVVVLLTAGSRAVAQTDFIPKAHHPNIAGITLFAENPDIMTPVGVAVAPDGRVFVQENHTHKRNSNYDGPKTDRILLFEDTDGDGTADKRSVFYEGHVFSTDLMFGPDGHLYFSTRWFVGRFRDAASLQKAEGEPEKLVSCETDGDYPHNGVGGLAIDPANPNWLAFGFGENLGADYAFVGTDGTRLSGGGEGGSTYRCRTDGSKLERLSTGHWNAFGMTYDLAGNLFSTDNDPNSTPPNRLLHVIPGADFGYEYRYGRSGRHPLVSWYGEIPGTLSMIGPLGEAACGVTTYGRAHLLSASWTDNRIDIHPLKKNGASFVAEREQFISGPDNFRPVHFSYSADGKYLYFTDWVKLSYPVHGHGRVWRVEFKKPIRLIPVPREPKAVLSPQAAIALLGDADPYVRTEAIHILTRNPEALTSYDWESNTSAVARAHHAVALKRLSPQGQADIIPLLLNDASEDVRFTGIKWIADEGLSQYRPNLEQLLNRADTSRRSLPAVIAALDKISGSSKGEFSPSETLLKLATDDSRPAALRALALQSVNIGHKSLTVEILAMIAGSKDVAIQREAIRSLTLHSDAKRGSVLARLATDASIDPNLRADAIAGLADFSSDHAAMLEQLVKDKNSSISTEAERTLIESGLLKRKLKAKPPATDIHAWERLLTDVSAKVNTAAGRRLFFRSKLGSCHKCHSMNGRGNDIGPDLTAIHRQSKIDRKRLLQHIVNPNADLAPYYRPQLIITTDGKVHTGFIVGREGGSQGYVGTDGKVFYIRKSDVEERRELTTSIMPAGLLDKMSIDEIRDLTAYLLKGGE